MVAGRGNIDKAAKSPIPVIPAGPVPVKTGSRNPEVSEKTGTGLSPA